MHWRWVQILSLVAVLLPGCAGLVSWNPDSYVVRQGDTLYGIAWQHGLDPQSLAAWNQLGSGNLIFPGQQIRLTAPDGWQPRSASTSSKSPVSGTSSNTSTTRSGKRQGTPPAATPAAPGNWVWPADGRLRSRFGEGALGGKGIDIGGRAGQAVVAASKGQVVYSGSGLIGYGQLIIIKHNDAYLSAYGYNRELFVKEGDRVAEGQKIASMGEGPGKVPVVHFEIRFQGKPVDPLRYLPPK
ncbi:MAG: peptidoglycan DD-metalloendopeptidase family protein [Gammaproteobacteria bacterium]